MDRLFEKNYIYDIDGNIIYAPTVYYFEEKQTNGSWKEVEVPAHDHDSNPTKYMNKEQYRFLDGDKEKTYQHCREYFDDHRHRWPEGTIDDLIYAFENNDIAPSAPKFIEEVLVTAELFAMITARAPSPDSLKQAIKRINDIALSKEQKEQQIENIKKKYGREKETDAIAFRKYFDKQAYIWVNNTELSKFFGWEEYLSSAERKVKATDRYIWYLTKIIGGYQQIDTHNRSKLWFSDDGFANIQAMLDFFASIYDNRYKRGYGEHPYDCLDYRVYYTGNLSKEELSQNIQNIKDKYPSLFFAEEDQSYKNSNGIWMPVTKVTIAASDQAESRE